MDLPQGSVDYTDNEFFSFRYSTRFQKNDIVQVRTGLDLEVARFQARKSFPDVLNEYWWFKPSDTPAFRGLPLQVQDVFYYHGGVPVVVFTTANGELARKAQIFLKKREEASSSLSAELKNQMAEASVSKLEELLLSFDLLIIKEAVKVLSSKFPEHVPSDADVAIILAIHQNNYGSLIGFGSQAVTLLLERFFVTTNAKEAENIIETIIEIGKQALPYLDDMIEYLSLMASPYYAKRIKWAATQIEKQKA